MLSGTERERSLQVVGWAVFLILLVTAVMVAAGAPLGPVVFLGSVMLVLFAYRYPHFTFSILVALVPFLGITLSVPTGELAIGERAFGGSVDISVGEVLALALLAAWAGKIVVLWWRRHDVNWKPWLPLAVPMAGVVGSHLLSAFSPFHPDVLLVVKYVLRPVLWCYILYVAMTANFIRSRKRLVTALGVIVATGCAAALMGFVSLGLPDNSQQLLPRARPLPVLGFSPLGDNHNLLAEWLVVSVPSTLALILLAKKPRTRHLLALAAGFQAMIGLLTFARTAWIVFAFEAMLLAWFVWRDEARRWIRPALIGAVLLLPLASVMFAFNSTAFIKGSTDTRAMLTGIALTLWSSSPWIGLGAGTYMERVGSTWIFVVEHGAPLDSHGFIQKLLAETGLIGLASVVILCFAALRVITRTREAIATHTRDLRVFTILAIASVGAFTYQLFNTSYWNGKLWLPLGIMLAASRVLQLPRGTPEPGADAEPLET